MAELPAGPIVPLVTPFDAAERIDTGAIRRLVEHVLAAHPAGLMSTALTGEGPLLTPPETAAVWESTVDAVDGRVPILGAIITTRTDTAITLARHGASLGMAALMPAPVLPELYAHRSLVDLAGFYTAIAEVTDLPLVLFNYPSLTGVDLTPAVIHHVLDRVPTVVAVKESSGDARRVHALHRRFGGRLEVVCGAPDTALESLALGARTWITGIMNVAPVAARHLMDTIAGGDLPTARHIYHHDILPIVDIMHASNNPTGTIKAGLQLNGCDPGPPRRPGNPLQNPHLRVLEAYLAGQRHTRPADMSMKESR